ncbi:AtzE family amidohydrolase [Xanthobacter tagetidis]|uniref:AtzE family amidohydrolase n=1 Tax=Xanthobacter tagetidis TaxID=60216 RepID=A0A3L7ABT5_9HYPH|nr:AtzE family amidohydrolase [Xanthobacter tagetidis]MBB6309567.1 aspartyl-tRNA(Asn)/glutamyl-tRNA(Gln) amidotransferase subunit A [Xanthobacter tagetidis]RLP77121.1 AtzE family amidohydrolase [Xanthobacter tagetidis]
MSEAVSAPFDLATANAATIAAAVNSGAVTARAVVEACLARIAALDGAVNAFTDVTAARARATADVLDARRAKGEALGALAGVPFAVKNLFDIKGLPTRAGSKINRDRAPAGADGTLIRLLEAQGAVLVGGLNMGEYAYDFTGENLHDGASRNPHALDHMSGGSSGGSGAAVAAGLVPLALGSDTNGSIRVPSALCGTFGLKPTYGRLSRAGSFPFVSSFDHLGPFARTVEDLARAYDAMQAADPDDPMQAPRPAEPVADTLGAGIGDLRIAVADGYFRTRGLPEAFAAVDKAAAALGVTRRIEVPDAARARAAAYVTTAAEGASLHLRRLAERPGDFDPAVRDRLLAGLAIPAAWVDAAQRFRRRFREEMLALFATCDVILAPATPCRAPKIGQKTFVLDGETLLVRPNMGLYTQPISFIGLPVAAVPVWIDHGLPLGVQVIAPPWREDLALRVAKALQDAGAADARVAAL